MLKVEIEGWDEHKLFAAVVSAVVTRLEATDDIAEWDEDEDRQMHQPVWRQVGQAVAARVTRAVRPELDRQIGALVKDAIEVEFQRTTEWGEPTGSPTSIRELAIKSAKEWMETPVDDNGDPRKGHRHRRGRKPDLTRHEWLVGKYVKEVVTAEIRDAVAEEVNAVRVAFRESLADGLAAAVAEKAKGRP